MLYPIMKAVRGPTKLSERCDLKRKEPKYSPKGVTSYAATDVPCGAAKNQGLLVFSDLMGFFVQPCCMLGRLRRFRVRGRGMRAMRNRLMRFPRFGGVRLMPFDWRMCLAGRGGQQ